jgi:peroxiredoxin family protein
MLASTNQMSIKMKNHEAIIQEENINIDSNNLNALIQRIERLEQKVTGLAKSPSQDIEDRLAIVVFSGDLDKAIAAFIIASGAAALGLEVSIFFTFWGINIIKKERHFREKNLLEKGFTALMPGNSENLPLSQMNYFGVGAKLIRRVMKDKGVSSIEELIETAQELGVRLVSCTMSQELLGISKLELMESTEDGDVASFLGDASRAKATLFI